MIQTEVLLIIEKLNAIPESRWPKLWCDLNRWKLPDVLFEDKKPFPNRIGGEDHYHFIMPIMKHIIDTVGMKKCNREWNIDKMTDGEHEQFWKGSILKP